MESNKGSACNFGIGNVFLPNTTIHISFFSIPFQIFHSTNHERNNDFCTIFPMFTLIVANCEQAYVYFFESTLLILKRKGPRCPHFLLQIVQSFRFLSQKQYEEYFLSERVLYVPPSSCFKLWRDLGFILLNNRRSNFEKKWSFVSHNHLTQRLA